MLNRRTITAVLVMATVMLLCVYTALAQSQPQPKPQKQESPREKLKEYYMENDEKVKSFTYKEQPAFKIYKPSKEWHFVDMSKYHGAQAQKARSQQQRQQIDGFFKVCKCIMHNGEANAEASVLVTMGILRKKLDLIMADMENSLKQSFADYKRVSLKSKKKRGAFGACLVFEGTPKGQPKDTHVWYFLVRDKCIYQLRMACETEKYEEAKKDFDKIYKKWKF
jgi:hypothetical protein